VIGIVAFMLALPLVSSAQKRKSESKIGIGIKVSSLGAGVEAAVPVFAKLNVRGGFNYLTYSQTFHQDGIPYVGKLNWQSGEASADWFPFGGFHVSPGLIFYNGNKVTATALVPGGQNFTLNGTQYQSSAADPLNGTGKLSFTKVAPKITVGVGNLIPRSGRHWSILAEVGVSYQGSPNAALAFQGSACDTSGVNCVNAATDPTVQANITAEQNKINNKLSIFKFYPLVSVGFGFNF
jgi:hypothetical protein